MNMKLSRIEKTVRNQAISFQECVRNFVFLNVIVFFAKKSFPIYLGKTSYL